MEREQLSSEKGRQRVLLVTHCFDADFSMESRLSWFRARHAAQQYDVTVVCAEPFADVRCSLDADISGLEIVTVPHTAFEKLLIKTPIGFYLAYRLWHRRVLNVARDLHAKLPYALVHQVSYCGYREPGYCWQLGIPFLWGPIGGTQNVPWRFLSQYDARGALKEGSRTVANEIQLRIGRRVGRALRAASKVFVANREIQQRFRDVRGIELPCQLETGVEKISAQPRPQRESQQPLRVLWAGRLENWKALSLLLKAVAQLPDNFAMELRIVGSGSRKDCLQRMANHLGIMDRIDWVSLPDCSSRDHHYQWADVFAFTSLRDTSGTGLLESLAAGVPIVGLDHQGARDIMTDKCAVPIPVESPQQVIAALKQALVKLASDTVLLQQLSQGALQQAQNFHWDSLHAEMSEVYADLLRVPDRVRPVRRLSNEVIVPQTTPIAG